MLYFSRLGRAAVCGCGARIAASAAAATSAAPRSLRSSRSSSSSIGGSRSAARAVLSTLAGQGAELDPCGEQATVDRKALDQQLRVARFKPIFDELAQGKLISRRDLEVGIKKAHPTAVITDEQLDRMFRLGDADDSGRIDLEEFMVLFDDIPDEDISLASLASSWLGYSHAVADPELIFQLTWRRLVQQQQGEENIQMPCEILFLGGAPGAGKGTMTPFIMRERGLDAQPIVMSSLLNSPAAKKIIEAGGLVSDFEVFQMLLEQLAKGEQANGCMVDGFPRTVVQVELLRLLHTKMKDLSGSLRVARMPRPRFRMCILYVDEHESVQRQLSRGRQALEHNKHVKESGEGDLCEVRETDLSVKAAKTRYRLFVEGTMAANEALKRNFPFNLINASGTVEEVKAVVLQELSYQSSLELAEDTYNAIRHIPTAAEITRHARVNLVARLDSYQRIHPAAFAGVVRVINDLFLPAIRRHALVGEARVAIPRPCTIFSQPLAMDMAVDVMFDRGFALRVEELAQEIRFKMTFRPPNLSNAANEARRTRAM